jgi:UDP-glucose 4-epimerase
MGLGPDRTEFEFSGTDRGWKGDVPVVRLSTTRVRALGWTNTMSTRQAMRASLESMVKEVNSGEPR